MKEFKNPESALRFAQKHKSMIVQRKFKIKTDDRTGIQFREYYYLVTRKVA